jgi:putative peptidoglycan lipid II flippase
LNSYGNLVFTAVASVLPIAIVTATFPVLCSTRGDDFDRTSAGSSRAVTLMAWLGTALMMAVTLPTAHLLSQHSSQVRPLELSFLLYAPGIVGFAIVTKMSRVLFALGKIRVAGVVLVTQQLVPAALSLPMVLLAPSTMTPMMLAAASSAGFLLVTVPTVLVVRRLRGPAVVHGLGRAAVAGMTAAVGGATAGFMLAALLPGRGTVVEVGAAAISALVAIGFFGFVAYALDSSDMQVALARLPGFRANRG